MTELIVALDLSATEARGLFNRLERETEVKWFKVGVRTMLDFGGPSLCERIAERWNLMMDLKCYDTRDTVAATARRAFELGARFLTVHATPSMLKASMAAKIDERQKVLAVGTLTDNRFDVGGPPQVAAMEGLVDGVVCSVAAAHWLRSALPSQRSKIIVCPGIRHKGTMTSDPFDADNHVNPATPAEARAAGADYVVVGRPIYQAEDPVTAAIAIMEELKG